MRVNLIFQALEEFLSLVWTEKLLFSSNRISFLCRLSAVLSKNDPLLLRIQTNFTNSPYYQAQHYNQARESKISRLLQIFLYIFFVRTGKVFVIEIHDLFFVARVTRIGQIPLDKQTLNLKTNLFFLSPVNHYSPQALPQ